MKKGIATIAIFLQILPLCTKASVIRSVDPRDVAVINGRRYYFSTITTNIPDAVTVCQELNMTLAGLETVEEFDAVTDYIRINLVSEKVIFPDFFWTSGIKEHTMWIWGNSGKPFSFLSWDADQPNNRQNEYNLFLYNGFMHDGYPYDSARFICEQATSC